MLLSDPLTLSHDILEIVHSTASPIRTRTMAQALFDEHPLGEYLREAGESPVLMPGSSAELDLELDIWQHIYSDAEDDTYPEWRPAILIELMDIFESAISSARPSNPFIERFKYDVISSSLMAPGLSIPHSRQDRKPRSIPGQLRADHSRTSSIETAPLPPAVEPEGYYWIFNIAFIMVTTFLSSGYAFLAVMSLGGTLYYVHRLKAIADAFRPEMTLTLEALSDLITSCDAWESTVQEAINILENDERSSSSSTSTPSLSSSTLRVALHSSLHTTQTQCDNVRHLFSALTYSSELSQLSEMYAPPSPVKPAFSPTIMLRPLSLPTSRSHASPISAGTAREAKRSTWNGATVTRINTRRLRRQTDISSLFGASEELPMKSFSAPVTPSSRSIGSLLSEVREEEDVEPQNDIHLHAEQDPSEHFGAAALSLRRKRKSNGMEALNEPSHRYSTIRASRVTSAATSPATSSPSRFTTIRSTRHPHSLSALHHGLEGALASRRYACSHLLALRFGDDEDEGYWEDVRSMMGLLKGTFVDATSRLADALDEVENQRMRDENPTPTSMSSDADGSECSVGEVRQGLRRVEEKVSFAPVLSHISRFAVHVDAISSALEDARENLEQCLVALREEPRPAGRRRRKRRSHSPVLTPAEGEAAQSEAVLAYERLRRELGLALRECERGRERLLDVVSPPDHGDGSDGEDSVDLPEFGHDTSDESDKQDWPSPMEEEIGHRRSDEFSVVSPDGAEAAVDDASSHLLLTASSVHLPPPGIEQVFESESGAGAIFTREKSKLTREERIKLVKARRESSNGGLGLEHHGDDPSPRPEDRGIERWGPGGEVVQELKDVIWKVGERRRKMGDAVASSF